jgi:hypothetical protein
VPAAHAAPLTVVAYYYAWYGAGGAHWNRGYTRAQLAIPERPLLGEYDSRDPAAIAAQYAWAQRYGVDVFVCSWWGPGGYNDLTIRNRLLASPARGPTKISLLYESLQRLGIGPDARVHLDAANTATMISDFAYLARTYFIDPGYYRIDGRPVATIYATRIFRGNLAGLVGALRATVEAIDGVDPYLIGDEVDWDSAPDPARIELFDAITGYTLYSRTQPSGWPTRTRFLARIERHVRSYARIAAAEGVGFIPDAMPGFNDRGFRPADAHHVLPPAVGPRAGPTSLFGASLAAAGALVDPALGVLAVTSWNEWHEDTQIEPTAAGAATSAPASVTEGYRYMPYGFGLLDTLAAFRARWHTAHRATERGLERRGAARRRLP